VSEALTCDVLVAGAGPAGLAAAQAASASGCHVLLVDDNPAPGGQIWRTAVGSASRTPGERMEASLDPALVRRCFSARLVDVPGAGTALVETTAGGRQVRYRALVIATGARERFLPFPGWTLPNVMGAGGLQAMVKSGLPIAGKRVVVAGTGPLLLAVAAHLRGRGARVLLIAEQAPWRGLLAFASGLFSRPSKLGQGMRLAAALTGIPFAAGSWVARAEGVGRLERVHLRGRGDAAYDCDYLAIGFHLVANTELAESLGCRLAGDAVAVNGLQQTSVPGVYCAGEPTGIGGVEKALVEGRIAGLAAAGREDEARRLIPERERWRGFARRLERTFALRPELRALPDAATIVCRCEDVAFSALAECTGWRHAKLHHRCGMGPCQGRICGPAVECLFGWRRESVRPPLYPARVATLCPEGTASTSLQENT
jgi:NADPH-dependent 2,4-dienoyl-CoA reductase/sulfur reductase-like enzyme